MPELPIQHPSTTTVTLRGRELIAFAGCNYLGLAHHPDLLRALSRGAAEAGITTAAARQTTGNTPIYEQLEHAVAELVGAEAAILTLDGYTANLAALQGLRHLADLALLDARAHASLLDAATLAGLRHHTWPHRSAAAAIHLAADNTGRGAAILTDGIFPADGTLAPLAELAAALPDNAWLLVDDCHGTGVLGRHGAGSPSHAGIAGHDRLIVTGTFAKALGCHGGFVAGPHHVCDLIRHTSTVYQTTTPVSPALAAAALESIAIIRRDTERLTRLRANTTRMRIGLRTAGLHLAETPAPIFAFLLHPPEVMDALHDALLDAGYLAPILAYPNGPADRYFRLAITSEHTTDHIDSFTTRLRRLL